MANPSIPVVAPGGPIPPPVMQLPWGKVGPGGDVTLTSQAYEFLQLLWSALQGGGGVIDLTALSFTADLGEVAALRQELDTALTAAMALPLSGEQAVAAVVAEKIGFGFGALGLLSDNAIMGPPGSWPVDVVFTASNPNSYLNALASTPAAADAVFRIMTDTLILLGTFTVAAGAHHGILAWVTDPYIHPANAPLFVFAPTPADATLGNVNALVVGKAA